jgi:hypothetical protein
VSMFNYGNVPPHGLEVPEHEACQRCSGRDVSDGDLFGSHCAQCLADIAAEVDADFGDAGRAQRMLAGHRAFADWLRARGR